MGMSRRTRRNKAGWVGSFSPSQLSLTAWWRGSYAAAPWVGTASAGVSANYNMVHDVSGTDPDVGSALNGYTPAVFGGAAETDQLKTAENTTVFCKTTGSIWCLFYASATPVAGINYQNGNFICDVSNAEVNFGYTDLGVTLCVYANSAYREVRQRGTFTNGWHLAQASWDATELRLRVDGGAWQTTATGAGYVPISPGAMRMGVSYAATNRVNGKIIELGIADSVLSEATWNKLIYYVNGRYGLTIPIPIHTPTGVTCSLWLRADLGVTLNGTDISSWADQSGLGNTFSQATAAKQPPYNAVDANLNNMPSIGPFHEADLHSLLWAGTTGQPPPYSVFMVIYNITNAVSKYAWGSSGAVQSDFYINDGLRFISGNVDIVTAAGTGWSGKYIAGGDSPITTGTVAVYHNAITAKATSAVGSEPPDLFSYGQRRIGRYAESGVNFAFPGTIAEIVVLGHVATLAERTALMNYFGSRYDITIGA